MLDQITITDTSPDKFKYLIGYIKHFEYLATDVQEIFNPHPITGHVYQILERDGQYIIHIGESNKPELKLKGIFLGSQLSGEVENKWVSDIVVITKENMLDFNIPSEDLIKINTWLETDHKDLKDTLYTKSTLSTVDGLDKESRAELPTMGDLLEMQRASNHIQMATDLNTLRAKDPDSFEALTGVVEYLAGESTCLATRGFIIRATSEEAYAAALTTTVEEYTQTGDEGLLLKAIELCFYELNRRAYLQPDNENQ